MVDITWCGLGSHDMGIMLVLKLTKINYYLIII